VGALGEIAKELPVLYPAHPRSQASLKRFGLLRHFRQIKNSKSEIGPNGLYIMEPLGYLDFIRAEMGAACVFTDSGGVQEETAFLGVPCFTLRRNTERPVTIARGTNQLAGVSKASILKAWAAYFDNHRVLPTESSRRIPKCRIPKWDGNAAPRIAAAIARFLHQQT
jgi:UDP-N-acetylglucosamine 2-epimerase (non-hydrolysing)